MIPAVFGRVEVCQAGSATRPNEHRTSESSLIMSTSAKTQGLSRHTMVDTQRYDLGYDSNASPDTPGERSALILERTNPTALQKHVAFFDRDNDNILWPWDIYNGFRELGFGIIFSIGSLLIPLFFSYPTNLAYSYFPDPFFRIYVNSMHKAKHGSDTGIYDSDGHLRPALFNELFDKFDKSGTGSLDVDELWMLLSKNRAAADPAGWSFAFMEWWTTWLLLQKDGRVWKEDLRQCYDGSLFWRIRDDRMKDKGWRQGYGWGDYVRSMYKGGTWKEWTLT